jgi:NAD(P)-dependent dehydrogenase (short-subunit alcohol dehydrogenase family)
MDFLHQLFDVSGKRVVITGGSRGIGLAIAEGFVRSGARVYICGRDAGACEEAAADLRKWGDCRAIACNVSTHEGRAQLVAAFSAQEDSLDVLINNAGALWAAPIEDYPERGWDKVFDLNVKATFYLIQQFLPLLEKAGQPGAPARIINVGSVNALRIPEHETYAYVSSKAAVHHLTRHLAGTLAKRNITANVLAPGLYPSKMLANDIEQKGEEQLTQKVPLRRLAGVADMAGAAIYLASPAGSFLTGAVIPVDGGMATTV